MSRIKSKPKPRIIRGSSPEVGVSDPFAFLPLAIDALLASDVSCKFCSVRMVSRAGIYGSVCPACFEERCSKCGDSVLLDDGSPAEGLTVGRGGSWKCAKCSRKAKAKAA